ncbi:MAG: DUF4038 domain-containing protein [Clostridiales bacterium]|jgi:hypothetical protein|nr:DUF4038 domain-containing protein [Clostridiales bacterium]
MQEVERYGVFEIRLDTVKGGQPPCAVFKRGEEFYTIRGFCENEDEAAIRFMPRSEGVWHYTAKCNGHTLEGDFNCVPCSGVNHGPVVANGCHFAYADGTRYIPMGTTCYAWIHQPPELMAQTLETLKGVPFNKIRMCVFPKSMPYNQNEPLWFPFESKVGGGWDVHKPVAAFWRNLESNIAALAALGIEADLILFHPYDRWGFSKMSREDNLTYLDYCIRRLAAYRNIWWSLANEYDLGFTKTIEDWDAFGEAVAALDPYGHLISVHNWVSIYPKRPWLTHVSIQKNDMSVAFNAREEYRLPVIVDECGYEGNIPFDWGNITGFELINRMWTAFCFGCYCAHGETFHRDDEVLWWSKGGKLYGESPSRIRFLYEVLKTLPGVMEPYASVLINDPNASSSNPEHAAFLKNIMENMGEKERAQIIGELTKPIGRHPDYRLQYLRRSCPVYMDMRLPQNGRYRLEVIDVWEMTREIICQKASGDIRIDLPGKEGIAVLVTRLEGDEL